MAAIIRWEQMTRRTFRCINFADEDDAQRLLYCSYIVGLDNPPSYAEFRTLIATNKRYRRLFVSAMERYNDFLLQFSARETPEEGAEQDASEGCSIGDIAAKLIVSGGIDARYVMQEMTIEDMTLFIKALNEKVRQEEESRRRWTYFSILPHVDGKKLSSPDKMMIFPWEAEQQKREAEKVLQDNKEKFERFMRGENA